MLKFLKKIFIGLWTSIVIACNHTKSVSLSNQKCTNQPTLIRLHPNEYTFAVNLDKLVQSCNTLNDLCFDGILRSVHKSEFKLYIASNTSLLSLHWF